MENIKNYLTKIDLQLFATNTTSTTTLSAEMKTFYDRNLIENATPVLVHDQFGQKRNIPDGSGKTIEFRKFSSLPKATTPLTEGVTPSGQSLTVTTVEATLAQYGDYVAISDVLDMTAKDPVIIETTNLIGSQAGETMDTVVREILNAGTNVQYAEGQVSARASLTASYKLTVNAIKLAVRFLKKQKAKPVDGRYFVGIIHPDVAYDLTSDDEWIDVKKYSDPEDLYEGEIGRIHGVRFVETTEAKIFAQAGAAPSSGADGVDVYSTLIIGANAYGTTTLGGRGIETIVKPLGAGEDALNQRATVGWKALKTAVRLVEGYMIRIETASTFSDGEAN